MDNFKCLTIFYCDDLNKKDTIVLVDLFETCERNLQDFSLSQKIGVILLIHSASHRFSPTKPKTHVIWVRKNLLRWVLFTCPWFNSFNCLWTCFVSSFWMFCFLDWFLLFFFLNPTILKIFKKKKMFYFVSSFISLEDYMNYDISLLI